MKKIVVSVTNDLVTDQRVAKVCNVLHKMGFSILLIGRKLPNSLPINRPYKTYRFKLFFNKGFLFYAEYNIRLFFKLLFTKSAIIVANDLDTLLPNFLISKLFRRKLVYDSHELFTEIPELANRPFVKKVWMLIERTIFPKLKNVYTVNNAIAAIYREKYNVNVKVVRNIAFKLTNSTVDKTFSEKTKGNKTMLILQGSGINIDRGAEEAIQMMRFLENAVLYIIGGGDVFTNLKKLVKELKLEEKVIILDKLPYNELMEYTKTADFGLSLDKGTNMNYELALPNKIFDYMHANTPLIVSNRKVVAELVKNESIGIVLNTYEPQKMALKVQELIENPQKTEKFKSNLITASKKYNWEIESQKVRKIYSNLQ